MNEHTLWNFLRLGIQHAGHMDRIESHATSVGFPDVNFCLRSVEGNLELKHCRRDYDGFELRTNQSRWLSRRVEAGGNCWILAEYDVPGKDHWLALIKGDQYRTLKSTTSPSAWKEAATVVWQAGEVDFDEMLDYLTGKEKAA